jgi:hypothetical protein
MPACLQLCSNLQPLEGELLEKHLVVDADSTVRKRSGDY